MSSIRGVVSRVSDNLYQGKTLYSIRLNGDNNYYNTGEKVPPVKQGDSIEFDVTYSKAGKPQVVLPSIRPWKSDEALQAAPVKQFTPSYQRVSGGNDKDTYWKDKEARDIRNDEERRLGASRNTAIAIVNLMLAQEAIKLPAKTAEREKVIWEAMNHYTEKLMANAPETVAVSTPQPDEELVKQDDWS